MDIHYTIREVANRLHKSEQSVVKWLKDGKLPYIEVSERRRLIVESDLNEFLNRRKIYPPDKHIDWGGPVFFGHGIGLKKLERCTRRT